MRNEPGFRWTRICENVLFSLMTGLEWKLKRGEGGGGRESIGEGGFFGLVLCFPSPRGYQARYRNVSRNVI